MGSKICRGCNKVKDLSEFYRHPQMNDGRLNYCKDCKKTEMKNNRSFKRERYAEYERRRNQTEKRKAYHAANLKALAEGESS